MFAELTEIRDVSVFDRPYQWTVLKPDNAFEDIIKGWEQSGYNSYMKDVKHRRVCIQAGGYCGIHPRLFGEEFNVVYTFEPDPLNFYCLVNNCQSDNIVKIHGCLGDSHQMVYPVRRIATNPGMNIVIPDDAIGFIPKFRIDDLILPACDLIQLDTEGCEYEILMGALRTIGMYKPVVVVEDTNDSIEQILHGFGYSLTTRSFRDSIYVCFEQQD